MRRAVFLDRDGTINEEVGYLDDPDRLQLISGAAEGIRLLNEAGIPTIVVSNQAGIGRGYFSAATVEAIPERLTEKLAKYGRIIVPLGHGTWSQMSGWYEEEVFRGHVREPSVSDLKYIANERLHYRAKLDGATIQGFNWCVH